MATTKPSNYNDLRVKKTEKAIRSAFFKLIQEKPTSKITIRELVTLAEINKTTFYAHYETIEDLIETLKQEGVDYIVAHLDNIHLLFDAPDQFIDNLYQTLYDSRIDTISHANHGDNIFSKQITDTLNEEIKKMDIDVNEYQQLGALISFIVRGLLSLIENHTDSRFANLEYIKTFVRGGIQALQK